MPRVACDSSERAATRDLKPLESWREQQTEMTEEMAGKENAGERAVCARADRAAREAPTRRRVQGESERRGAPRRLWVHPAPHILVCAVHSLPGMKRRRASSPTASLTSATSSASLAASSSAASLSLSLATGSGRTSCSSSPFKRLNLHA